MKRNLNGKGFTLIELIVVIAVIGILVLLAAPRFLGYTRDANVAAMKADAKILSNAALVYNIDNEVKENGETWPVAATPVAVPQFTISPVDTAGVATVVTTDDTIINGFQIDKTKLDGKYIKNLKNPIEDYVIVTTGDNAGDVFYVAGTKDRLNKQWFGVALDGVKLP